MKKINKYVQYGIVVVLVSGICGVLAVVFGSQWIKNHIPYQGRLFRVGARVVYTMRDMGDMVYLFKSTAPSSLPLYEVFIKPADSTRLEATLDAIHSNRRLSEKIKESVPARFVFGGKEYGVEVSHRGAQDIHWNAAKKSYAIRFDKSEGLDGIEKLNLILPLDRKYIVEHLNNYRAQKFGLMHVPSRYVNLKINGELQGIYLQQEGWSNAYLNHVGKSDKGTLFKTRDIRSEFCQDRVLYYDCIKKYAALWEVAAGQDTADSYVALKKLFEVFSIEDNARFIEEAQTIVDVKKFLTWNAHYILMQSYHQGVTNLRLYYDPQTRLFEPVAWDVNIDMNHRHEHIPSNRDEVDIRYSPLIDRLLAVPAYRHERNVILWNYVNDDTQLEDDVAFYDTTYKEIQGDVYRDRLKRQSNYGFDKDVAVFRDDITRYAKNLKSLLKQGASIVQVVDYELSEPTAIDIVTESFASLELEALSFSLNDKQLNGEILVYQDTNNNKIFDPTDMLRESAQVKDGQIEFQGIRGMLSVPYVPEKGVIQPVVETRFFIIRPTEKFTPTPITDIEVRVVNFHTKKEVDIVGLH